MKKVYLLFSCLFISSAVLAQEIKNVGIGTAMPDKSAVLDIQSADKGLLIPRLSKDQMNSIISPAKGLLVFKNEADDSGFFFYNGEKWSPLRGNDVNAIATVDANGWALDGNLVSTATKARATSASFIGVPSDVPINFKIGAAQAGKIDISANRNTLLGLESGSSITGKDNASLGYFSLRSSTSGNGNLGIGTYALLKNTQGNDNVGVGTSTLQENLVGNNNVAIGKGALRSIIASNNIGIGAFSGFFNTGSGSIFIGTNAGYNATGSNKLYIANSNTATPLVYGDFSAKFLSIGDVPVAKRDAVASSGQYSLIVEKGILSEKLKVALKSSTDWADYVFEPEYKSNMMSLEEVEKFTLENKHLPNVPSATELVEKGLDFNETSKMFMEKIEELTLYLIELNKEVKALKVENSELKSKLNK